MVLTFSIDAWVVPHLLTCIDVDPSLLMLAVHLCPDVIFTVPHPPDPGAGCSAEHAKAIGEFSRSSSPSLQQCPNLGVSWKSVVCATSGVTAFVQLNSRRASSLFVWC